MKLIKNRIGLELLRCSCRSAQPPFTAKFARNQGVQQQQNGWAPLHGHSQIINLALILPDRQERWKERSTHAAAELISAHHLHSTSTTADGYQQNAQLASFCTSISRIYHTYIVRRRRWLCVAVIRNGMCQRSSADIWRVLVLLSCSSSP